MEMLGRPLTKTEIKMLQISWEDIKKQFKELINFFNLREDYKVKLKEAIKKYGVSKLPSDVLKTVPPDLRVLYELPWYLHISVWVYMVKIAVQRASNEKFRSVTNG